MRSSRHALALAVVAGLLSLGLHVATPVAALDEPTEPNVLVLLSHDFVGGQGWVEGNLVDFYYNGDHVATAEAEPNAEGSASPFFPLGDLDIDIAPGDTIELRMGDYSTGDHVVTSLAVTFVSASKDTVAGTAAPGSEVLVAIRPDESQPLLTVDRYEVADADGEWLAHFSKPGDRADEQALFDFGPGSHGFAIQGDENENATALIWQPPETERHHFNEQYTIPADTAAVPDTGWLNIGCSDDFVWPEGDDEAYLPVGVSYEMASGKLKVKESGRYVGIDSDGHDLYEMTQSSAFKGAVFELNDMFLDYRGADDWEFVLEPTGVFYELVSFVGETDGTFFAEPGEPLEQRNLGIIEGSVHFEFHLDEVDTGDPGHWVHLEGTISADDFVGINDGTCNI